MKTQTRRSFLVSGLIILAPSFALEAVAQRRRKRLGKWTKLGEKSVSDKVERDTIVVTRSRGDFTAIKLRVSKRAVEFRDLKIRYGNGTVQDVELRRVIPKGGESRVIDLQGRDRVIKSIELIYDAQSLLSGSARVEVWGRR